MMRSLFSAVSGLKAHQTKFDVSGNNIANVNTVGYKSQSATFSDVFYQTTQSASGANAETGKGGSNPRQIGLGSAIGSITTNMESQGSPESTGNPYDLMINGSQFFIIDNNGETCFTRAGNFVKDVDGALVTASGSHVLGWQVDDDGNVIKDKVSAVYVGGTKFEKTSPAATTSASVSGNISAANTDDVTFTVNFYDSLGNEYQATLTASYDAQNSQNGVVSYSITGGSVTKNSQPTTLTVSCDKSFQFNSTTGKAISDVMSSLQLQITGGDDVANIGTNSGNTSTINFDATKVTYYASDSKLIGAKGIDGKGTGKPVGTMTAVGIDTSGRIVANYSNGDIKTIGQVAVASFSNPAGLEKVGENLYRATMNSGEFDGIGEDVSTNGSMKSSYLEMSNVDLAQEFTQMIITQRGYQANSRVITVSDTLLEELINLKR